MKNKKPIFGAIEFILFLLVIASLYDGFKVINNSSITVVLILLMQFVTIVAITSQRRNK